VANEDTRHQDAVQVGADVASAGLDVTIGLVPEVAAGAGEVAVELVGGIAVGALEVASETGVIETAVGAIVDAVTAIW